MVSLSFTHRRWILKQPEPLVPDAFIGDLLKNRDITADHQVMQPPTLFAQLPQALARITRAVDAGERIGIFGDYDCDGITAAAQLLRYFRRRGIEPVVRLPHRLEDGYGLNRSIIDALAQQGVQLLLTVDTGIAAVGEIAYAASLGMDSIVTDHHHAPSELPPALAILHPALAPKWRGAHPSGAGVALALVRALEGDRWADMETDLMLACIGTIADLVPLTGDNRTLVQHGLRCLSSVATGPLAALRELCGIRGSCTSTDVGYRIAPRINAAGRLADPGLALQGLLGDLMALQTMDDINRQRQQQTEVLFEQAVAQIGLDKTPLSADGRPLLCVSDKAFHPGIIGLIAGKLTQHYGRPSLAVFVDGDRCTGSLRSPACYHITEGLSRIAHLLSSFGGHAQAAGCSFALDNLPHIEAELTRDIAARVEPDRLLPALCIEAVLNPADITLPFLTALETLEPHGTGNEKPFFLLRNVTVEGSRLVGKEQNHLQCTVAGCKAIGFRLGTLLPQLRQPVDIACRLDCNEWNGRREPQIIIEDIASSSNQAVFSWSDERQSAVAG